MAQDTIATSYRKAIAGNSKQSSPFKRVRMNQFPDIPLFGCNAFELYKKFGGGGGLDYTSESGTSIAIRGPIFDESLKRTRLFLTGRGNSIVIEGIRSTKRLDIACANGSNVVVKSPETIRGLTIFCSHGSFARIGAGCMIARDVLIYSSRAHGLYSVADGVKRSKDGVDIGERVWLGQGARILAGARVGNGSVIGSYSVLAGKIFNNCAAAGNPCRVTTRDVFWTGRTIATKESYFETLKRERKPVPAFIKYTEQEG